MKAQPQSSESFPDQAILSAWREQVAKATPGLSQTLVTQQPALLPHFAAYYSHLQQLPRRVRRDLQRQCRRVRRAHRLLVHGMHATRIQSLAGVALLLVLGQAPALAATINIGGGCALVDAITAANTNNAIGLCKAGNGKDTLVLRAGSNHTLTTVNNGYVGPSGLPVVTSAITIAGNGGTIARSSAASTPPFRILIVGAGGNLTLRQTTVTGGSLPGDSLGGGVANAVAGTLTVTNSTISGNKATGNQGGGGVFNNGPDAKSGPGTLVVTNSTISGNTSKFAGGVRNDGVASLTDSTISGNTSFTRGGGVANVRGSLSLTNSTLLRNIAGHDGGGASNYQGTVTLINTTVSGNSAGDRNAAGGDVRVGHGGGLYNGFGRMFLTNSTVVGNLVLNAQSQGGGVFGGGRVGNLRSDIILNRTLISSNVAFIGNEIFQVDGGVVTANNFNLFGHSGRTNAQAFFGFAPSGTDITATSDGTRPTAQPSILNFNPANNGGPTQTHALVPGSPAIDAVATGCPLQTTDQRGVPRPQDGNNDGISLCDIGAFERAP